MSSTWTIVKFITDNSVEAVPTSWVADGKCAWPNYTRERLMKAIRTCEPPMSSWNHHEIKPFRNATYDNYVTARQKSMRAEETSDLNSDCDNSKRVSKRPNTFLTDSDSEQSDNSSSAKNSDVEVFSEFPQIKIQKSVSDMHESPNNLGTLENTHTSRSSNAKEKELSSGSKILENTNASRSSNAKEKELSSGSSILENTNAARSSKAKEKELSSGSKVNDVMDKCTCCEIHKHEAASNNGFLKQIIRKLTIMEMDVCDIKKILDRSPVTIPETENVWGEFEIPFTTLEDLNLFEEFLTKEENMKKSINELSRIGGDNANEFMKRAMSKMITHKLAAEFSWIGLKKKKIFSKLLTADLLIRSAQQNGKTSGSTIKEMEEGIKKVLRRAAERAIAEQKKRS